MSETSKPKITLHWLEASRAQRIVWLLEELKIDYELKLYHRINNLADPALKKVHPLGKSPLVEIDYNDGNPPLVLAESGHIITYLIRNFDYNGVFSSLTEREHQEVEYYLHFAEGSFQPLFLILILHSLGLSKVPFFLKPIVTRFVSAIDDFFTLKEIVAQLDYLESVLAKNATLVKEGEPLFFVNNKFSGADIILIFNLYIVFEGGRFNKLNLDKSKYPHLQKYVKQIEARPALKLAEEKIEQVGGKGEYIVYAG